MSIDAERRKVLEMIENGKLSAVEGLNLMNVLMDIDDDPQPETNFPPQDTISETLQQPYTNKWNWLWQIPLWLGIILVVLGTIDLFLVIRSIGFGIWFILAWLPLLAGVFWIAFAWECRSAHWLCLQIRQKWGERRANYSFGFPMPLRFVTWLLSIFGDKIPPEKKQSLKQLIQTLETQTSSKYPIFIDINGYEEDRQVQLVIG